MVLLLFRDHRRCKKSSFLRNVTVLSAAAVPYYNSGLVAGCPFKQAVSVSGSHTCAILDDGRLKCWGENFRGELGLGDNGVGTDRGDESEEMGVNLPYVDLGSEVSQVALGSGYTCALLDTEVLCWGSNSDGQLGLGENTNTNEPTDSVNFGPGLTATHITARRSHTCALLENATQATSVKCWGWNNYGQLGTGDNTDTNEPTDSVDFGPGLTATQIRADEGHTCALLKNETQATSVKCWGDNEYGQLGLGDNNNTNAPTGSVNFGPGLTVTQITTGRLHTCALLESATQATSVKCWGLNNRGQLGTGDNTDTNQPVAVVFPAGVMSVTQIGAGAFSTCALDDTGDVWCWGRNNYGQLGLGNKTDTTAPSEPIDFGFGHTVRQFAVGDFHACALLDNYEIKCWGRNDDGQLGLGDQEDRGDESGEMGDNLPYVELCPFGTCADIQQCSMLNQTAFDDTDELQVLSFNESTKVLSLLKSDGSPHGLPIDLSSLVDAMNATDELQVLSFNETTKVLSLLKSDGTTHGLPIDLSSLVDAMNTTAELQVLAFNESTKLLSLQKNDGMPHGPPVDLSSLADAMNTTDELQALSFNESTKLLSLVKSDGTKHGPSIFLPRVVTIQASAVNFAGKKDRQRRTRQLSGLAAGSHSGVRSDAASQYEARRRAIEITYAGTQSSSGFTAYKDCEVVGMSVTLDAPFTKGGAAFYLEVLDSTGTTVVKTSETVNFNENDGGLVTGSVEFNQPIPVAVNELVRFNIDNNVFGGKVQPKKNSAFLMAFINI